MKARDLGFGFGSGRPSKAVKGRFVVLDSTYPQVVRVDETSKKDPSYWMYSIVAKCASREMAMSLARILNRRRSAARATKEAK